MTVYVDDMRRPARVGRISGTWSHLFADTRKELHTFAARIGLKPEWFQARCKGCNPAFECPHWHYDVTDSLRQKAIAAGAQQISYMRDVAGILDQRRAEIRARTEQAGDQS